MQQLRLLSVSIFAFLFVLTAAAEDKQKSEFLLLPKDIYFQPGGGLRARYDNLRNATATAFSNAEDDSRILQRAQFDFKIYKGEYFETFFRFLHSSQWGSSAGNTSPGEKDNFDRNNGILVNQAWAQWKVDEIFGLTFGRAPIVLGRGLTYGANEWFNVPYSFDQFRLGLDWESVKLDFITAKARELTTVSGQTLSPDPEENHIIVDVDIKNSSDAVKVFNFHFIQVNRDLGSDDSGTTVLNGLNMQRLAFDLDVQGQNLLFSSFITYVTGEERIADINKGTGDPEKKNIQQVAADIKAGYLFPQSNDLKLWLGYHYDSGDSGDRNDVSQTYDSFYYDVYGQAGVMDFLRWGNLSYYRFGLDVDLNSRVNLGGEWLSFTKTESQGSIQFGDAGRFMQARLDANEITLSNDKDLGSEFDIWLDYKATSGVSVRSTIAVFFPGNAFENATVGSAGNQPSSTIYQFVTQVGFFF